ncbi:MAG: LON peptidase substrate-binding domain-containing protein, partial [Ottowia sp.]|nr:LON peptidase substrate-binding domain-containing protein [Ottowia sp.]
MPEVTPLPAEPIDLPLLPLRDVVVFPNMVIPLFVGRQRSIRALESAMTEGGGRILLLAQKTASDDEPSERDLFDVGCVSKLLQLLKLPDGTVKVLVEGRQRARVESVFTASGYTAARVVPLTAPRVTARAATEIEALRRVLQQQFEQYAHLRKIAPEILASITATEDAGVLADTIAAHMPLKLENKQTALSLGRVRERLEFMLRELEREIDILHVDRRIRGRVKQQMEKNQHDFYLNEQIKAIQKELGEGEDGTDFNEIAKSIKAARMPEEARKKAESELKKLRLMSPMSAEANVVRSYIDTLTSLPWAKKTRVTKNLAQAQDVLNADHYGLEKVKERILEYLAVQQRVDNLSRLKSPILCLVGPPGIGKTSLGQSIAKATGRK